MIIDNDQTAADIFNAIATEAVTGGDAPNVSDDGLVNAQVRASLSDVVLADIKAANAKELAAQDLCDRTIDIDGGRIVASDLFMAFTGLETASTAKLNENERRVYNAIAYITRIANHKLVLLGQIEAKTKAEKASVVGDDGQTESEDQPGEEKGWTNEKLADYIIQQCGNDAERVKAVFGHALNLIHHA